MGEKHPRPLWERQPQDSNESWPYFRAYRDLTGTRQLRRVRLAVTGATAPPMEQLKEWYDAHGWKERVAAYDAHMDALFQEEKEALLKQSARDMAAEHLAIVQDAAEIAQRGLEALVQAARENEAVGLLKPGELIKLMEAAIKLGRLVKGEATERGESKSTLDFSGHTVQELRQLAALRDKAKK